MNPNISLAKILQTSTRPDSNDIAKSVTHSHNHISPGGWGHRRRRRRCRQDKRTQQLCCKSEKLIALRDELLRWESSTGYASTASAAGWLAAREWRVTWYLRLAKVWFGRCWLLFISSLLPTKLLFTWLETNLATTIRANSKMQKVQVFDCDSIPRKWIGLDVRVCFGKFVFSECMLHSIIAIAIILIVPVKFWTHM